MTTSRPSGGLDAQVTWVGHATVHLEVAGFRVLTDPLLRRRVAHLRRRSALPDPSVADVDVVLLSHAHMDHLHLPSLGDIVGPATVVAPRGTRSLLKRSGFDSVVEVVSGDRIDAGPATIEVVDAVHRAGRGPQSRVTAVPVGYVVEIDGHRSYFAGDTDLFDGMGGLGPIDLALIPIWGWGSSVGYGHLDPARAGEAVALIQPEIVIPIHWGTYSVEDGRGRPPAWFDEPPERFGAVLADAGLAGRLRVLRPGEMLDVGRDSRRPTG